MINAKTDDRHFKKYLKDFSVKVGKTAEDSVKSLAAMGARQIANDVQPFGLANKSKDILEKAVYKDISKTYWDTGRTYNAIKKIKPKLAAAYAKAINEGEPNKAEKIAQSVFSGFEVNAMDSGRHLKASRSIKGRVINPDPMGITDRSQLEAFKAKQALTAGTAKAGWLQAAKSLGSKSKIAAWLNKTGNLGTSSIIKNGWKTIVTVMNNVRYASAVISDSKIQQAINKAYRNNLKIMERKIQALANKK